MKKSFAVFAIVILSACGGGSDSAVPAPPAPPPPPPAAVEAFTQSIQNLALNDFYEVSFGGLLSRRPESLISSTLDDIYPLDSVTLNNWAPK